MMKRIETKRIDDLYQDTALHIETAYDQECKPDIWEAAGKAADIRLKKPQRKESSDYELTQQKNKKNEMSYIIKDIGILTCPHNFQQDAG